MTDESKGLEPAGAGSHRSLIGLQPGKDREGLDKGLTGEAAVTKEHLTEIEISHGNQV
jgi:hypothetical protein